MKDVDSIIEYVSSENSDAQMFRDPDFLSAIVGYTFNKLDLPVLVYNYDKMIESLAAEYVDSDNATMDAIEWIEYNTLRTLPYISSKGRPVIVYSCN